MVGEGSAERVEVGAGELVQVVEVKDAVVREGYLTGPYGRAAADEPGGADGVMGSAERSVALLAETGRVADRRDLPLLAVGELGKDRDQTAREHRRARARTAA